ncbi:sugar kinase [Methylibium rhizosphaerae]|uniref:sugar kinase n=1 Tax=Methylibium rhizosphaerae TaxID=2570323 RepID=UPI001127603A|nr:sugar kinase [Methylibium rhizosphaerae]
MSTGDRKVVLVTRRTRLEELVARHHTLGQARFYIEHLGADFSDYVKENAAYAQSLDVTVSTLQAWGRYQLVERSFLPNFVFAPDDIVVALGQDGLVANTMKYLEGQPLVGLNPEPSRWDGVLLPFEPKDLLAVLTDIAADQRPAQTVTMAEARLSDGQRLRAVNDLFIGPRSHSSALYEIELGSRREFQSSSGVIVSTGLGSTAWLKSVVTGSLGIAQALKGGHEVDYQPQAWDSAQLTFAVREPFPSRASRTELVYGAVTEQQPLLLRSRMPDNGVIFSDGMEADYLRFTAGMEAKISVSATRGQLMV